MAGSNHKKEPNVRDKNFSRLDNIKYKLLFEQNSYTRKVIGKLNANMLSSLSQRFNSQPALIS